MHDKEISQSQLSESWGRFAGRMYFLSDQKYPESPPNSSTLQKDSVCIYIAISVVYFFLIAVILIILLLAPKYRIPSAPPTETTTHTSEVGQFTNDAIAGFHEQNGRDEVGDIDHFTDSLEEPFPGSPVDPLYAVDLDLDPRSFHEVIEDDDELNVKNKEENLSSNRLRMNSKFLQ